MNLPMLVLSRKYWDRESCSPAVDTFQVYIAENQSVSGHIRVIVERQNLLSGEI